jgi:2-polyprenyl-3-methyl-5-hydroxy-6-metoxy-1,4-benzoquinol methylase
MKFNSILKTYTKMDPIGKILLFIVLFLLTISICKVVFKNNSNEGFQNDVYSNGNYDNINKNKDMFDNFYASIYDFIAFDEGKNNFEIKKIIELTNPNMNSVILDIGSGMGHHVKALNENYCGEIIGIDKSLDMVNYSKHIHPDISASFQNIDITTGKAFPNQHFSHILCLYFTIYYIQDQKSFLHNCFNMLQNNGFMILHLVNKDAISTLLRPDYVNGVSNNYVPKTTIDFNKFQYISTFDTSVDNKNVVFKEQFTFKNGKKRTHNHSLFMNDQEVILNYARSVGFIIHAKVDMSDCEYDNHYLYILQKPY